MANIAKTYTFANGTPADGTQVNKNFDDIIAGVGETTDLHPVITAAAQTVLDDATVADMRATLGAAALANSDTVVILGSDVTTTSASFVDVTGLSFSALANSSYLIEVYLRWISATANLGALACNGPATPTFVSASGNASAGGRTANAYDVYFLDSPASAGGAGGEYGEILLVTGATAGTFILRISSVYSSLVTVYAGSVLKYRKIA
jgi:hypothetical protein